MFLTKDNAHLYIGKKLDARRRLFHDYPLEVIQVNGEFATKGSAGVCCIVPPASDKHNAVFFDFVVEEG